MIQNQNKKMPAGITNRFSGCFDAAFQALLSTAEFRVM